MDFLAPQVTTRIMSEIRDLVRNPPAGVSFVENEEDSISEVHAEITGPEDTPYVGGKFRLKLVISSEYPAAPPRGYFLTKIYHPNIANNGDICVNTLKKDWTPEVTLKHVFQVIRCLLIVPFPESSLNDEAGKLFMESYDEYARRARIVTEVHALDTTTPPSTSPSSSSINNSTKFSSSSSSSTSRTSGLIGDEENSQNGSLTPTAESEEGGKVKASSSTSTATSSAAVAKKKSLKRL